MAPVSGACVIGRPITCEVCVIMKERWRVVPECVEIRSFKCFLHALESDDVGEN